MVISRNLCSSAGYFGQLPSYLFRQRGRLVCFEDGLGPFEQSFLIAARALYEARSETLSVYQLGLPELAAQELDRVLLSEEVPTRPHLMDGVHSQVLRTDTESAQKPAGVANDFVAHDDGGRTAKHPLTQVADVVDEIRPIQRSHENTQGMFHGGLCIK